MLQIRLGRKRHAELNDHLGRSTTGSWPGMSEQQAWEVGRGTWKVNAVRALAQDEVQIIDLEGTVLAVAKINGVCKHDDRYELKGDLLLPSVSRSKQH